MSTPSLYHRFKAELGQPKAVVSDAESLLLNRRDFHISQVSAVHATLASFGINISYPFRVFMSFLEGFAVALGGRDFNIFLTDPSLGIAAYHVWLRGGGGGGKGRIFAPRGIPKFPSKSGLLGEFVADFEACVERKPDARPDLERARLFTFVIGNTKTSAQTLFAIDRFLEVETGLLLLKDFARVDASDERDYLEAKRLFPSVTYEGHAFFLRM